MIWCGGLRFPELLSSLIFTIARVASDVASKRNGLSRLALQRHDARARDLLFPTESTSVCSHPGGLDPSSKVRERPRFSGCSCVAFPQDQGNQFRTTSGLATGAEAKATVEHIIMVKRRRTNRKPATNSGEKSYRERYVQQSGVGAQDRYLPESTHVPTARQRVVRCEARRAACQIAIRCASDPDSHAPEKP